jgi:hypothetical protein
MTISATTKGMKPGVCTSSTRPQSPYVGQMIFETDTNKLKIWLGSYWSSGQSLS